MKAVRFHEYGDPGVLRYEDVERIFLAKEAFSAAPAQLPLVPLVHGFGRAGCFLMGCCYGVPSRFGIAFTCSPIAPNGVRLLPVQLIEAAGEGALFFALTRPGAQRRSRRPAWSCRAR